MFRKTRFVWMSLLVCLAPAASETRTFAPSDEKRAKAQELGIVGDYQAEGTLPNDRRYSARLTVRRKGEVYLLSWSAPGEGTSYSGVGLRDGNTLAASWILHGPTPLTGVMLYKISEGPRLEAEWALHPTDGKIYKEVCKPLKKR